MTGARHRRPRYAAPTPPQSDRARFALTFLAVAGLVGPAWALREHAAPLLDGASRRSTVVAPEASARPDH
ncbi:hypothetical protein OH809_22545 [Streptomyces sp. NBC_00873]|uniref:hypothetical protein n=1 Tax=unclassified Streptomyces TaxID=2593676 RepID=UPI00386DFEDF|nr:hypothetical protein OH809_22545 [Streptomyces sp. NBC_00873]WTA44752.1 hypothetical protein OH821_20750 [Streptomyces sp. NBC_00842]